MEIGRSLDHNLRLARVLSSHQILEASTKRGTIATCWFSLPLNIERTGVSSGNSVACQRAPIGDSLNDEQWSDHLSNPSSH